MYFKLRSDTFVRTYENVGYIINKSAFADRVVDAAGVLFLHALSRQAQSLEDLTANIAAKFIDADIAKIKQDAQHFFTMLTQEGFLVCGATKEETDKAMSGFSYSALMQSPHIQVFGLETKCTDTQSFLSEHFKAKPRLLSLHIEITSRCNERCIHCYIPHHVKNTSIDPALFYEVLRQCKSMGVMDLTFSGGEPMLHPQFCNFLRKAKEMDFSVGILSNLTMLDDKILAVIKEGVLASVNVSLYSMNAEIHDAITMLAGSHKKTIAGIHKLIANDIPVQISCPVMKQNIDSVAAVLQFGQDYKCRVINDYMIMARFDHSSDNLVHRISLEEVSSVIETIMENDVIYQHKTLSPAFEMLNTIDKDISEDTICGVCNTYICMTANGNVYPCSAWQGYILGNVKDTTLAEIWSNSPKIKYLRGIRRKDFPKCLSCADRDFCAVCMAKNFNESGDMFCIPEDFCKIASLNRSIVHQWISKQKQ
jgi:radical SAM protein with 4Fe4S-binding SPASM domain